MTLKLWTALLALVTASGVAFAQQKQDTMKKDGDKKGAKTVNVRMGAQNKSGESGTAKLTPQGSDKTRVEISLKGAPKGTPQPAHIHDGTCAKLDPKPKYPLQNVVDGKSTSTVDQSIATLMKGNLAINVHKSGDDIKTYVSCGNIGKGGAAKKGGGKMEPKKS